MADADRLFDGPDPGALSHPWLWRALGGLWLAIVVWLSLTPSPPSPPSLLGWDKAQHCLAYACLAGWHLQVWPRAWAVAVGLVLVGLGLEVLQGMGPVRAFEWTDALANAAGVVIGAAACRTPLGVSLRGVERACLAARGER